MLENAGFYITQTTVSFSFLFFSFLFFSFLFFLFFDLLSFLIFFSFLFLRSLPPPPGLAVVKPGALSPVLTRSCAACRLHRNSLTVLQISCRAQLRCAFSPTSQRLASRKSGTEVWGGKHGHLACTILPHDGTLLTHEGWRLISSVVP